MNIAKSVLVVLALCLCVADCAPERRLTRKQQRPTRGFKNVEMMTARGFGKRSNPSIRSEQLEGYAAPSRRRFNPKSSLMVATGFGKRDNSEANSDESIGEVYGLDNFWNQLEASTEGEVEGNQESIPVDWFVNEMLNNPDFTRSVVRKFIDLNQDGMLSPDELLRNVA